jgi:hypothetical protein
MPSGVHPGMTRVAAVTVATAEHGADVQSGIIAPQR